MDLDSILEALESDVETERRAAARRLFRDSRDLRWGDDLDTADIDRLVGYLDDADPLVRGHLTAVVGELAFGLVSFDEPVPALDVLLGQLTDEDPSVRQTVLGVLHDRSDHAHWDSPDTYEDGNRIRELAAVGFLHCLDDETELVRKRAADHVSASLITDHPELEETVVPILFRRLDDGLPSVRRTAIESIGSLAADAPDLIESYTDDIVELLDDPHEEVRIGAARALTGIDRPDAMERLTDTLIEAIDEGDDEQQREAMETIGTLVTRAPGVGDHVVTVLLDRFADPDFFVRGSAAVQLVTIAKQDPEKVPEAIVALAERDTEKPLDRKGIFPLALTAETHPEFAAERLAELCRDIASPNFESGATVGLICTKVAQRDVNAVGPAVDVLQNLLDHEDEDVRGDAVLALADVSEVAPRVVLDASPDLARTLSTVEPHPRNKGSKVLLSTALLEPDRLASVGGELDELFDTIHTELRHNVGATLAVLADSDVESSGVLGERLASYLTAEHPDRCWKYDHLVFVGPHDEHDFDEPFLKDDCRWPFAPIAASEEFIDVETVTAHIDDLPVNHFHVKRLTRYLTEIGHGDDELLNCAAERLRILAEVDGERGEQAHEVLAELADTFPSRIEVTSRD